MADTMRAFVMTEVGKTAVVDKPIPTPGPEEAVVRTTTALICTSDVHTVRGALPIENGRTLGHESVGVVHALGSAVSGFSEGQRVAVNAVTPCFRCDYCQRGFTSQCGGALGGYRYTAQIDGNMAEYFIVPAAAANLTPIPDDVTDEQVVLLADIASTGFSAAESGKVRIGDSVVVFACGPIGLCAIAGAKLSGASLIIGVDSDPVRLEMARRMGADTVLDFTKVDVVDEVKRLTGGGADVTIEALGTQGTFENALRCLRPGGTLSSLGVYSGKLEMPYEAFAAGLGDHRIVTTLCPGGKERMRRLIATVQSGRFDPLPLITHRFALDDIVEAYDLFSNRRDGVLKVVIHP